MLNELPVMLFDNVPRFIAYIKEQEIIPGEFKWLCSDSEDSLAYILDHADKYLLFPKDEKTFKNGLFILVRALAIMSFIPGGVKIFGLHFDADIEGFVRDER